MKALLFAVSILAVAATANAETFRRAGSACQVKTGDWNWTEFGVGIKNMGTTAFTIVCPLDAVGESAANLTHRRIRFHGPVGTRPQCIFAAHNEKGSAMWKYILSAPAAGSDGLTTLDYGDSHVPENPPLPVTTTTATLRCTLGAGVSLLYYTYDDE